MTLTEFQNLPKSERMSLIMQMGDSAQIDFFPFLKYAILVDPDINVKFAALKRIHFFKEHPDSIPIMKELENSGDTKSLEPYFSIAQSRLGIISADEFNRRING